MDCGRAGGYKIDDIREYYRRLMWQTGSSMEGNLTIGALLAQGIERLRNATGPLTDAGLDAEVLLAQALSMSRTQLKTHPENVPSHERARRYVELIERRAAGEPVADRKSTRLNS